MTQQTLCPACGAPLEYKGEKDIVTCGFCSTDISVIREDDDVRFEVLAQPDPQKEVLSHVVEPQIDVSQVSETVIEERAVSDFPDFFTPAASMGPVSSPGGLDNPPGAQVYQPGSPPASSNTTRNWILIALGIVLGLCVLCACLVGAGILLFSVSAPVAW